MINTYSSISKIVEQNNSAFAIRIDHYHYITKDKSKATSIVHIDSKAEAGVQIIKELKDPNDTHKYTAKNCNQEIRRRLNKLNISNIRFNQYHFNLFCKYYDIKRNTKLCYVYKVGTQPKYSYSVQTIDFIVGEIKKNPESIIQDLKEKLQKQKK